MTALRQRFIEDWQLRNRSPRTIECYVFHLKKFAAHFKQAPDQLGAEKRCASTSNRNFEGRQGRGGRTHLVSPAVAAASAIMGRFASPEELA